MNHRDWGGSSEEHQPVTWLHGHAIYAAHVLMLVFVVTMLATTAMMAFHVGGLLQWLPFSSDLVLRGQVWRIVTYGLVNPPSLWFVVDMFMLVWFGRELEKFFGRRTFLVLYGCLYFLTPLLFTLIGLRWPMGLAGEAGSFALFIAFATLYPDVAMLFGILAKWLAAVLVGIYTLMLFSENNWSQLISMWATVGFAFGFVRYQQGALALPRLRLWKRRPKLRVLPDLPAKKTSTVAAPSAKEAATMAEVDALLDKIATSGIGSLTPKERAKLESAREGLMKRGAGRG